MKKMFNRAKRSKQDWNGYNEGEFDWDSGEEIPGGDSYCAEEDGFAEGDEGYFAEVDDLSEGDEAYYVEEDDLAEGDEAYYAEEDEHAGGDEAYYAEEADFVEGDETYYAGEADLAESDEAYYAGGDALGEDNEAYYAEEDDLAEGDEAYYAGDDGAYYADGSESVIEEDTEKYCAVDDNIGEETALVSGIDRKNPPRSKGRKKGFWIKFGNAFANMSILDRAIMGLGVAVLILALITAGVYIDNRVSDGYISELASVGTQLDGIDIIGGAGLLAVEDAQIAKMAAASIVTDELEDENKEYNEQDYQSEVQVVMEFTSIQRDLKIKFINKNTNKLIANVPFAVNGTDPDGKSFIWSDDDMDGIIYKKDITPGSYKLAMEALSDEKYSRYVYSTTVETVTVKKDIEYKKVDVDNEVKTESEVDVNKEDTKDNETVVESTLQDTVAWVESTVTPGAYIEVPKSSIPDPKTLVAWTLDKTFLRATASGGDAETETPTPTEGPVTSPTPEPTKEPDITPTPEPTKEPELTVKLDTTKVSVSVGQTVGPIQITVTGAEISDVDFFVEPPTDSCATVTVKDGKVTVKGDKEGATAPYTIRAETKDGRRSAEATLHVTVTAAKEITLDKKELTVFVNDDPVAITANVSNAGPNTPKVTAVSSDEGVLKVVKCENNVVYIQGVKEADQTVTVTVTYTEDGSLPISTSCLVKVRANPKDDTKTKLKDSKGVQLYVKVDEKTYREAVHADYYNKDIKFYIMGDVKYTGWQTIDGKVYFFTADGKKVTGEQVIQGAKYNFASDGSLVTGSGALGIDVSKYNGNIDWNAVKNSGINYVIIRCGYRGYTTGSLIEDPKFTTNIKGAIAAGLKVGVYFVTQAIDEREAVEEASMVLSQIKNYKISYPVFLDVETSGGAGSGRADSIDKTTRTAVCKAFCQTIKNAGYNAGVYANKNWWETKINASELSAYKIWLAQYASTPTYTGRYDLWQYRSTGRVSGISGDVDMNLSYLGY